MTTKSVQKFINNTKSTKSIKSTKSKFLNLEYPYYKYIVYSKIPDIIDYTCKIYNYIPTELTNRQIDHYEDIYFIIKDNYKKAEFINNLTNYYTEEIRVKCNFKNNISPLDYWNKYKQNIISDVINKYNKLSIYYIREIIYFQTKLCSNFRITVALTILNYFKPKTWLDISSGWGDRLMSAIIYDVDLYVGCDPNLDLHPGYNKMIFDHVSPLKRKNFIIYKNGFLEAKLPNIKFDIVFTSPPFFTTEIYSKYPEIL
jgi:hypothetical protein